MEVVLPRKSKSVYFPWYREDHRSAGSHPVAKPDQRELSDHHRSMKCLELTGRPFPTAHLPAGIIAQIDAAGNAAFDEDAIKGEKG